jgi:hypothetical protein
MICQRARYGFGFAFDDAKKGARGTIGPAPSLLPILQRIQLETEALRELAL